MQDKIHPGYHNKVVVTCACGATFVTGSTVTEIRTELCSACHPFYTGKQKLVDTARRVEKFQSRIENAKVATNTRGNKKARREKRDASKTPAITPALKVETKDQVAQ